MGASKNDPTTPLKTAPSPSKNHRRDTPVAFWTSDDCSGVTTSVLILLPPDSRGMVDPGLKCAMNQGTSRHLKYPGRSVRRLDLHVANRALQCQVCRQRSWCATLDR